MEGVTLKVMYVVAETVFSFEATLITDINFPVVIVTVNPDLT